MDFTRVTMNYGKFISLSVYIRRSSPEQLQSFRGIRMNNDTCCSSQKSQLGFLKLSLMDLSLLMACYDDSYQKLKKKG